MSKWLRIEMSDGSLWDIPCYVIAMNYAKYFQEIEGGTLEKHYNDVNSSNELLIDWAEGDMDWSDVENSAVLYRPGTTDFEQGWANGHKKIIEY